MSPASPLHMPQRDPAVPSVGAIALALPRLSAELAGIGFEVTDEALIAAAAATAPVRLSDLVDRSIGPGLVGPAWRSVLEHGRFPLVAVAVTVEALEAAPAACARSLSAVGRRYDRTLAFARAMLGMRVYEHAREMWARQLEYGGRAYAASARMFERALSAEELLSEDTLRLVQGMAAVVTLVLSRARPASAAELTLARDRLRSSIARGNRRPESAAYLAELHLRTYDRSYDVTELEDGLASVDTVSGSDDSPSLRLTACELGLRLLSHAPGSDAASVVDRVASDLSKAKSFGRLDEHDRVRLALLESIVAAHRRVDGARPVLREMDLRGAPLPFGLRVRLVQLRGRRSGQFLPLAQALTECLARLASEPSPPRLGLEILAAIKSLEAGFVSGVRPLDGAALTREGIAIRIRALEGAPAGRMSVWRLGSEHRDLFRLTGDLPEAVAAAERFAEAAALDPSWPVPLVDLAELAADERLAQALPDREDPQLARVAAGDVEGLFAAAAARSLNNREFEHRVLALIFRDPAGRGSVGRCWPVRG